MKLYLAGRYSRRAELAGYAAQLRAAGHEVTSRWLDGEHEAVELGGKATRIDEAEWAYADAHDILRADMLVLFTEADGVGRGERHVEFGMAVAWDKDLAIIGPREHLFHAMCDVQEYGSFAEFSGEIGVVEVPV